jgi:DNA-binding IclR family transcriptional regulator
VIRKLDALSVNGLSVAPMTNRTIAAQVLECLHALHVAGRRPSLAGLVRRTGVPAVRVADALADLGARGFVDPGRVRLTLAGFAVAHALKVKTERSGAVAA